MWLVASGTGGMNILTFVSSYLITTTITTLCYFLFDFNSSDKILWNFKRNYYICLHRVTFLVM